jgi:hypothetical protein
VRRGGRRGRGADEGEGGGEEGREESVSVKGCLLGRLKPAKEAGTLGG